MYILVVVLMEDFGTLFVMLMNWLRRNDFFPRYSYIFIGMLEIHLGVVQNVEGAGLYSWSLRFCRLPSYLAGYGVFDGLLQAASGSNVIAMDVCSWRYFL